jgi:hypothetical protein
MTDCALAHENDQIGPAFSPLVITCAPRVWGTSGYGLPSDRGCIESALEEGGTPAHDGLAATE